MTEEVVTKGIILSSAPQGEYGLRLSVLTDRLGRITVFAAGARKQGSRLMGAVRPMTAAAFSLIRGKQAWTLRQADVMDSFGELTADYDLSVYAAYVLELGGYFSEEGLPEEDSRAMLNLMFLTLDALRRGRFPAELIRRIYELRMLVISGEYSTEPESETNAAAVRLWHFAVAAPLGKLYRSAERMMENAAGEKPAGADKEALTEFAGNVERLFRRQITHRFRSEKMLELSDI